ncbi:MAG: hypothetical protein ACYCQJ_11395 [Nitrososphaerales archaeon]
MPIAAAARRISSGRKNASGNAAEFIGDVFGPARLEVTHVVEMLVVAEVVVLDDVILVVEVVGHV